MAIHENQITTYSIKKGATTSAFFMHLIQMDYSFKFNMNA